MKRPTLVTGGCGFVGRHLVKALLTRNEDIWIIDDLSTGKHPRAWAGKASEKIHFIEADAIAFFREEMRRETPTLPAFGDVFHLASIVGGRALIDGDPVMVASDLAIDAMFFLWATRKPAKAERILYASSSAAYPTALQGVTGAEALAEPMINFEKLGAPDMTYGWSKLTGEYLSRLASSRYGLHIACVRPFSGYGEDQDLTYPTPSIALRVARGDDPIEVWGTGEQGRDFVHIDDCVDAFFPILEKVKDGSGINIGTGTVTSFRKLIERMLALEGRTASIKALTNKPVGVANRYADITQLTKNIGWKPRLSLDEGLTKVLQGAHERLKGNDLPFVID